MKNKNSVLAEKNKISSKQKKEKQMQNTSNSILFRHLKKMYPLGIHQRSNSLLSVSSLASSLTSLNSTTSDSSSAVTDYFSCPLDQKILASLESLRRVITAAPADHDGCREQGVDGDCYDISNNNDNNAVVRHLQRMSMISRQISDGGDHGCYDQGIMIKRRCHWITKNSDNAYVSFHDEQWGVPVYEDKQLFELLAMSAMLMDYNWTEILKRKERLREAFGGFDPNVVANMGEDTITDIASNKDLGLAECRARCFVENARAILKIVKESGSFSSYVWAYLDYKPVINKYKYPRNVPLRSPKAETMSKDLIRRGFRLVGPVIVHSFMQAAGMTIDHLVSCFRYKECVALAENPWRHV